LASLLVVIWLVGYLVGCLVRWLYGCYLASLFIS